MSDAIRIVPATPTGSHRSLVHLNMGDKPHEWREMDIDEFDDTFGRQVRQLRLDRHISLRVGAVHLGIGVADLSGLEFGRLVPASEADAATIIRILSEVPFV